MIGPESTGLNGMDPWVHIIGGGLSGLSLASSLAEFNDLPGEVVVSEPELEKLATKTFSFWFTKDEAKFLAPEYTCRTWTLSTTTSQTTHHGEKFEYGTRSGQHVLDTAIQKIADHPQITITTEPLQNRPTAQHIFDSRPCDISSFQLIQSFAGTEVIFNKPHQVEMVSLMDQMQATETGIRFVYVLPLTPTRLLVEHTEFTTLPADLSALHNLNHSYLSDHFDESSFQIARTEEAHIPMGFKQESTHWGIPLGARAGMTRDATGYGYRTIRYACQVMAQDLIKKNTIKPYQKSWLATWADSLFLNLIERRPDVIPSILFQIANTMKPDRFAAFMMMRSSFDLMHMVRAAPVKPFTCALLGRYQWI